MTEATNTEQPTIYATLVRGLYHDYNGKVWSAHEGGTLTHKVTETEAEYMAANAVDRKTVDEQEELIQRFRFSDTPPGEDDGAEEEQAPRPRVRRRSQG